MSHYDTQVICLNGHQITDRISISKKNTNYCVKCGAKGESNCPKCKQSIRGYLHQDGIMDLTRRTAPIPRNCANCGTAFPWRDKLEQQSVFGTPAQRLNKILQRFHSVARQLRSRHNRRETLSIKDEYDVQDLLHALLRIYFDDVRPEEWTPSYAGKSSRMDFLLKPEKLVVEVKMTRKALTDKEVGDQLIVDIDRYKEYPDCDLLICFVYDPDGYVRNPSGLCGDLEKNEKKIKVSVVVTP